jgi:hypothetical protein
MEFLFGEDKDPIRGESDCPGFRKFYAGGTVEYAMLIDCNGVRNVLRRWQDKICSLG